MTTTSYDLPDAQGHFGPYGGIFVAETLIPALTELNAAYEAARRYVAALHKGGEPTAESLWLGIRIERRLGDRAAEASLVPMYDPKSERVRM